MQFRHAIGFWALQTHYYGNITVQPPLIKGCLDVGFVVKDYRWCRNTMVCWIYWRLPTMFWRLSSLIWQNGVGLAAPSRLPETRAPWAGVIARIILAAALAWSPQPMRLSRSAVKVYWKWTLTPTHCDPPLFEIFCRAKTAWHGLATSPIWPRSAHIRSPDVTIALFR